MFSHVCVWLVVLDSDPEDSLRDMTVGLRDVKRKGRMGKVGRSTSTWSQMELEKRKSVKDENTVSVCGDGV